ncbi:MAG: hypothetical protein EOP48_24125 [Sphingobacteriales bacterium]|nr:MAG: hypothetical protein EOP48_24125 [Sphingobacteriales bacterium]
MSKLSGLQLDVLKLYRALLRSARKKSAISSDLYNFGKVCLNVFTHFKSRFY